MDEWRRPQRSGLSLSLRRKRKSKASQNSQISPSQLTLTSTASSPFQSAQQQLSLSPPPPPPPPPPTESQQQPAPTLSTTSNVLDAYACPVCDQDLTNVRSSYLRQNHVDNCLSMSDPPTTASGPQSQDEFIYCIFCGKDISRLPVKQKELHFSRCLDDLSSVESSTYAGQSLPVIEELDVCPLCHQAAQCNRATLVRRKLQHIKKCMKTKGINMAVLLQKLRWVQWGHRPIERTPHPTSAEPISLSPPTHVQDVSIHATEVPDDDDDFSNSVVLHRRPGLSDRQRQQQQAAEDAVDEELQLVIALSRSEAEQSSNNRHHRQPITILAPDESRNAVRNQLKQALLSTRIITTRQAYNTRQLPPSDVRPVLGWPPDRLGRQRQRAHTTTTTDPPTSMRSASLWNLAAGSQDTCIYSSEFILKLHSSQN